MNKSAESSIPLSRCVLVLAPWNQLLDGSINLSPLSPSTTNDWPVSIATSLLQCLPYFVPFSGMVHHLPVVQKQTHTDTDTDTDTDKETQTQDYRFNLFEFF